MDILQLIDRLEELFNESKNIRLTRNVMVDEDRMLDIIDQMRIAIACGKLHDAQTVTARVKPHGFRIDCHDGAKIKPVGQIVLIQMNGHGAAFLCWCGIGRL